MNTDLFDYPLPPERIAQQPTSVRDQSRMLVVDRRNRTLSHHRFFEIGQFLQPGDCLIRNTARVLPARIFGVRPSGGRVECFLLRPTDDSREWWCLLRPGRKLPPGSSFLRDGEFEATVVEKSGSAEYRVRLNPVRPESVPELAERIGRVPLPPYIVRDEGPSTDLDRTRYQTVYADAERPVAAAAPTAGLHFTPGLLEQLEGQGIETTDVTLHVGLGTFRPIESEHVEEHVIHKEFYEIPAETRRRLVSMGSGRRIAVGTTSLRSIEDYARRNGQPQGADPFVAEADLFIVPPSDFHMTDALITNFHLPKSTLLCLVSAFLTPGSTDGVEWFKEIYAEAIDRDYRFLSYGDAMLIV